MMDDEKKPVRPPIRYKLYDKLKINTSLKTMDIIIYTIVALLIAAVVIGTIIK